MCISPLTCSAFNQSGLLWCLISKPCCEQFLVGTIFFLPNYTFQADYSTEGKIESTNGCNVR